MTTIADEILQLEQWLLQPHSPADADRLDRLLHASFEEIGTSGTVSGKPQAIEWLLRAPENNHWSLSEFRINPLSENLLLATYCACKTDPDLGRQKHSRRSSIWRKSEIGWTLLFHLGSNLAG